MRKGYRDWPIDQSGALYAEKLEHAQRFGLAGRNYYAQTRNPPYWARAEGAIDALLVRHSVGLLLQEIDSRLKQAGLKLFLHDAWRPRSVQAYFHDVWMPQELKRRRPELTDSQIATEVQRYWAAPTTDPARPAPHATGGAVDLTIVWDDDEPLYMGSLFDDATELAGTDRFERDTDEPSFSHDEARANRRLLYWLMIEAGFSNHPDEWWHYSYGDQMWAIHMGKPAALYGLAAPDEDLLS
ncbi:MAG TPA: M15 family metallopeptidase [Caulobacterales bacterium]|nr:M15 family metallopeptidase [Caulobacterales bacterium]